MKTKSFFGENGLTSTSANHYCNIAKELVRKLQNNLDNVTFYSTDMSVIGDTTSGTISNGVKPEALGNIRNHIIAISELHSLIAFFREAIAEKERLAEEAKKWEDKVVRSILREEDREIGRNAPERGDYITELDVLETWSVGEQEKYLSLQAKASAYGKAIHEDGCISNARINLMNKISNPTLVKENGRDTIIYKFIPTVEQTDVDNLYFSLQSEYREIQAELNGMKKRIQDAIEANKLKVDEEYGLALQAHNEKDRNQHRKYQELAEIESQKRIKMLEEIQNLKIVVPKRLKDIFDSLCVK